ncbi:uncharacterized protein LOC143372144 isoform X1 [Andrena cerasifolii]|uniref:uncharacterized protein LOC143372144 isoform X1 n=1 Tax=Andrena cerasifolii TaxID=2819439 RepID=UPI00403832C2
MFYLFVSFLSILSVSTFPVSIAAEDAKATVFPSAGNGSVAEPASGFGADPRADMTSLSQPLERPFVVTTNQFLPGNSFVSPQRTFIHHRSDSLPYVYGHPSYGYPVAHSIDHPVGPSSKQLVIVSFIGLMLLFAIIQNTIVAVKRRDISGALSARDKRDLYAAYNFNSVTSEQEDVLNEDARVRCIQKAVCVENRKLVKAFGAVGKILAKYLTRSVEKSLKPSSGWNRLVEDAGEAGTRDEDCNVLYRDCEESVSSKDHGAPKT